ncbi:CHAD domain-containing protein [Arthrobacter sp. CDRTa11]|uniref:CHAD domain-containing protein n=1 Tax=Arthrobacter sp. CDRTa11 TaxID=2651199 RepID=UPI002265F98E|nr:CHAD domain-containing protein [Arthrobacter sp. CDRTa11]UZX04492.1 CHAD domain-containing protein [Arthrobacter sp. CDRTa11]
MSGVQEQQAGSGRSSGAPHQSRTRPRAALADYLLDQLNVLEGNLPLAGAGDPEAVHNARVAVRRFRSVATCNRFLLPDFPADDVGMLKTLARGLGESRDAEVQAERLSLVLDANGPWHREESLRKLVEALRARAVERAATLEQTATGPVLARARRVLAAGWGHTGRMEVTAALQNRWERLGILMAKAREPLPLDEHHFQLHNVRKAIKGLRYSAEAVTASFGEPALAIVRPAIALQRLLGEQHDAVVASILLTATANVDPRDAAALAQLESLRAVAAETEFLRLLALDPVPSPAIVMALGRTESPRP